VAETSDPQAERPDLCVAFGTSRMAEVEHGQRVLTLAGIPASIHAREGTGEPWAELLVPRGRLAESGELLRLALSESHPRRPQETWFFLRQGNRWQMWRRVAVGLLTVIGLALLGRLLRAALS